MYPKARFNEKIRLLKKGMVVRSGWAILRILLEYRGTVNGEFPGNPRVACTAPDPARVVLGKSGRE